MIDTINAEAFKNMILSAGAALEKNKQLLNELNVFPVPDGDTGTNMSLTMASAAESLNKQSPVMVGDAAEITASALLRGARGNSGVILSLLFRGMGKHLKGKDTADSFDLACAMEDGVEAAYKAVMKPAEGTILTVSRTATKAALEFAEAGSDIELMLICALESAKSALKETTAQNPVLKKAGVVDAGGKGYVIILDAMLAAVQGREISAPEVPDAPGAVFETLDKADFSAFETGDIKFAYCTEFIVSRENRRSPDLLRTMLEGMGDSVVVVDDDEIIKTHVHTNEPGKVITEALAYGSLESVKIENMRQQHTGLGTEGNAKRYIAPAEKKYGVVAVCAGAGMEGIFRELGADRIVAGGQTMNPSTEDILSEVEKTPAETVFVFPNNKNIQMAAEQCVPLSEKKVVVIPSKNVPQGVSALLSMDAQAGEEELTAAFTDAMSRVHSALVTYAARDSEFDGNRIMAGEYLALLDGALMGSFTDMSTLLEKLTCSLNEFSPEFISVYYGEDVTEAEARVAMAPLSEFFPGAEFNLVFGGQPVYSYMISAE